MKPRVLLDIDGVLANFYCGFANFLNKAYGCTLDVYDEPEKYEFDNWGHGIDKVNKDEAINKWVRSNGYLNMPVFEGASEFVRKLNDMCDVYIVTARIGDWNKELPDDIRSTIKSDTYGWLKKLDIPVDKLVFAHKKTDFCLDNGIGTMIEDKMSTALDASKNNIKTILINRKYNTSPVDRARVYRAYSYDDVIDILRKLYS